MSRTHTSLPFSRMGGGPYNWHDVLLFIPSLIALFLFSSVINYYALFGGAYINTSILPPCRNRIILMQQQNGINQYDSLQGTGVQIMPEGMHLSHKKLCHATESDL